MTVDTAIREALGVQPPDAVSPFINMLIYGEPGAGKTYFIGTAMDHEETFPLLLLDVEGGSLTLRKRQGIDVIRVRTIDQVQKIQNKLFMAGENIYYKTVAIDSGTELQKLDMRTVMDLAYNKNPATVDKEVPSPREWGKSGIRMRDIIRAYRDLPVNFIMTAQRGQEVIEDRNITKYYPQFPGQLRGDAPGYFDVVGYLDASKKRDEPTKRTMQFVKTEKVAAKDRFSALGDTMTDCTIPLMWEAIYS